MEIESRDDTLLTGIAARLRQLEDHRDILQTLNTYHHAVGKQDVERWLNIFTDDGSLALCEADGRVTQELKGRAARSRWFIERTGKWPLGSESHAYANPLVTVEGDRATASGFFLTTNMEGPEISLRSAGDYEDRLVRCPDGRWRIALRRLIKRLVRKG